MQLEEFKNFISQIEGYCTKEDCFLLYSLVKSLKDKEGDILEIGSLKGRVSVALAKGLIDTGKRDRVYSVDVNFFKTKEQFLENIRRFDMQDRIIPIFTHSAKASIGWEKPLKLIWIDTDGSYFSAKCDFFLWERYLCKEGIIALGCISSPSIKRFVKNYIVGSRRFSKVTVNGAIIFAHKNIETPAQNKYQIIFIRTLYMIHYLFKKTFYKFTSFTFPGLTDKDFFLKKIINKTFDKISEIIIGE